MITAVSNVRVSLTDHQCFVHLISVEFSEYNIELDDLVDFRYLNSTQLSDDRLDRFRLRGLTRGLKRPLKYLDCNETLNRIGQT